MAGIIFDHKAIAGALKRLNGAVSEIAEGDVCRVAICPGHMVFEPEGGICGCAIARAPCWPCQNAKLVCDHCGWKP